MQEHTDLAVVDGEGNGSLLPSVADAVAAAVADAQVGHSAEELRWMETQKQVFRGASHSGNALRPLLERHTLRAIGEEVLDLPRWWLQQSAWAQKCEVIAAKVLRET
jgi:hypothetical protein